MKAQILIYLFNVVTIHGTAELVVSFATTHVSALRRKVTAPQSSTWSWFPDFCSVLVGGLWPPIFPVATPPRTSSLVLSLALLVCMMHGDDDDDDDDDDDGGVCVCALA